MKDEALIMGMPVTIEIIDALALKSDIEEVFSYFRQVDEQFSTYKETSEISQINRGVILEKDYTPEMKHVLALCEETKNETSGYFDIKNNGKIDPSGLVKGYAIWRGSQMLTQKGFKNFYIEIAGDIQTSGLTKDSKPWRVGIENPFDRREIIKIVELFKNEGIATSGTYIRGNHIYDPHTGNPAAEIASVSVIGPNIYEADRFATAAFVMGKSGVEFLEKRPFLSGYLVTKDKTALKTTNFSQFEVN